MQYLGGKSRIAKKLVDYMRPWIVERGIYVEPFVGGANVIAHVQAPVRIASDANEALITMWAAASCGWEPPQVVSEKDYASLKHAKNPADPRTAFAGFGCSFGGKWFNGYARNATGDNYATRAARAVKQKSSRLSDVLWFSGSYDTVPILPCSVVYCDPPYAATTGYAAVGGFDSLRFWEWCRLISTQGHVVFVSEYSAPSDFKCVLEINAVLSLRHKSGQTHKTEKLFMAPP